MLQKHFDLLELDLVKVLQMFRILGCGVSITQAQTRHSVVLGF